MPLGIIADDVTGATDIASVIRRSGREVVLTLGVPRDTPPVSDAIVVATKTRMAPLAEAIDTAGQALQFLTDCGATQIYFKYCSTFDSTDAGNIGPITDYLLDRLAAPLAVACPSYPTMQRTVYNGHLFVGLQLLSDSPMRDHPLTPMRDSNLVQVLARQTSSQVGLIDLACVEKGSDAVREKLTGLSAAGARMAIADGIFDRHLETLASALKDAPLVTGGAALGAELCKQGVPSPSQAGSLDPVAGPVAILSGSCSAATLGQVAYMQDRLPGMALDPVTLADDPAALDAVVEQALAFARSGSFMVVSSADPQAIARAQQQLGRDRAAALLEETFAQIATALVDAGVRKFVVAGGETSGAVTGALGITMMRFGKEVAPGVPLAYTVKPDGLVLALKSGNFGEEAFFAQAMEAM